MKVFSVFTLTLALILSQLGALLCANEALAQGDRPGGGGDLLRCRVEGHRKKQFYLLDVYEHMNSADPLFLNLGGPDLNIHEKIDLVRDAFANLDPVRAELYSKEAHKIAEDLTANLRKLPTPHILAVALDQRLMDIDDANDVFSFQNCEKFQLVRQKDPRIGKGAFYQFDIKLWPLLDLDNQVATLYHEVIYREFRNYGAEVSLPSRWFNGRLFSRTAHLMTAEEYLDFLSRNGARRYTFRTNIGDIVIKNMHPSEFLWTATFNRRGEIATVPTADLNPEWTQMLGLKFDLPKITELVFDSKKRLVRLNGEFRFSFNTTGQRIASAKIPCLNTALLCIESKSIEVSEDRLSFEIKNEQTSVTFDADGKIIKIQNL
jgi:hypothetical protein